LTAINKNELLMATLEGHKVHYTDLGEYIQIDGTDIRMNALAFTNQLAHKEVIQFNVNLLSQHFLGNRVLTESFAGFGETIDQSILDGFAKYCRCSSHPILSVFINRNLEPDQVTWEQWGKHDRSWDVCLGPLFLISNPPADSHKIITAGNLDTLMASIRDRYLSQATHELHWLRIYYGSVKGQCGGKEVLLDNEPWKPGEEIVDRLIWPRLPDYYSIRIFIIAITAQPKKGWKFW
jgi:hypothetical protein